MNQHNVFPADPSPVDLGAAIDVFDGLAEVPGGPGAQLAWIRERAASFVTQFRSSGTPDGVRTCDLVTLPYPTKFGLFRAALTPAPFLTITNRPHDRTTDRQVRVFACT